MSQVHVIRDSFNAGELSPLLSSRFSVEKVNSGCRKLRNFIPHVHGPAFRRPGMEYMGASMGNGAKSSLRAFNFSTTTSAVLELHPSGLQVWVDGAPVTLRSAVALPYNDAECAEVQMAQVNDTVYLVHPNHAPRKLVRYPENDWRLSEIEWKWPALGDENARPDTTAAATVTTLGEVPTYEWPEFEITGGESFTLDVVDPDLTSALKVLRLFRWTGSAWNQMKSLNWTTAPPTPYTSSLGATADARITYDGPIAGGGSKITLTRPVGDFELPLDVFQPENLEPVTVQPGEWSVLLQMPIGVSLPTGAKLWVNKVVGASQVNLVKLTPVHSGVVRWNGPTLAAATDIICKWVGRAVPDGFARVRQNVVPISGNITILPSATTGDAITLTATEPIFETGHIGAYWQITHRRDLAHTQIVAAQPTISAATSATLMVSGKWDVFTYGIWTSTLYLEKNVKGTWEVVRSWKAAGERNIIASGTEDAPVEMRLRIAAGTAEASDEAAVPYFVLEAADARVNGLVRITAVGAEVEDGKAVSATADVIVDLYAATATALWTEGAWSDARGFPRAIAIHGQRLWFGGTRTEPQRLWGSVVNDFEDMRRSSFDDAGVSFVPASQASNPIQWMLGHGKELVVGSAGNEFTLGSEGAIVTPTDVQIQPRSAYGSAYLPAMMLGDGAAFVQRGGVKLRLVAPRAENIAWSASDLTVLAEHIARDGITQIAVMTHPFTILWAVCGGKLLGMTFESEQNVFGWHVHETNGEVESVAVLTGQAGDEVWLLVNRGGNRGIQRFDSRVFAQEFTDNPMYLDAAKRFELTLEATEFTGLEHLEGESVTILADGAEVGTAVVTDGTVTLETAASDVVIGLPFTSTLQPMRMEIPLTDGTSQHRNWKVTRIGLFLHESLGGEVAESPDGRFEKLNYRRVATAMDAPPPLHSGEIETVVEARTRKGADATIRTSAALPFNVGSITLALDVHGE